MFAVVILHYQNTEVTMQCVEHILKLNYDPQIVVVDNASPNRSGYELKKLYENAQYINVLLLDKNVGFAMGNNEGYRFAREQLAAETILVINSDLYIYDADFLKRLSGKIQDNPNNAILAVDIISAYGVHQNPYRANLISTKRQHQIILRKRIGQIIYFIPKLNEWIISRKPESSTAKNIEKQYQEQIDIIPHGACVIYAPAWVEKENKAFLEGTFLFCEEEILYDYCKYKGYTIRYLPDLEVHHLEDASQKAVSASAIEKKKNQLKYEIQSRKVLIKYRKSYK